MTKSLYWYDFEAGGANPRADRPTQFAGVRTDEALNIIGEPLVEYCQQTPDYLPHPQACLITGITPQKTLREGLPEAEFARLIHAQFCQPETTIVGYNNVRYDDEMTRFMLYRNFYDPYAHSWQNGNSRWDIVDLVRACYALRPEGIEWPQRDDGLPSFKLEDLSIANGIEHGQAHDAMSDVYATIGMAKRIKEVQPRLYDYYYQLRRKQNVQKLLDEAMVQSKPLVHVSSQYGSSRGNLSWVFPLGYHPSQPNTVIAWQLDQAPQQWAAVSPETINAQLYLRRDQRDVDQVRPGLVNITCNKCPFIAPLKTLSTERAAHFAMDWGQAEANLAMLQEDPGLRQHLLDAASFESQEPRPTPSDVEMQLYSGPFFSEQAKSQMEMIRSSSPEQLGGLQLPWDDSRLPELLFRYRARNYPHTLTQPEVDRWRAHCRQRLTEGSQHHLNIDEFVLILEQLVQENEQNGRNMGILQALATYVQDL
jgi:exodeoxyribonuclease-1